MARDFRPYPADISPVSLQGMRHPSIDHPVSLERRACFELLGQVSIGRVGVTIDALPVVLPLQFVVSEQALLVQTVRGTKLDAALCDAVVAFQADAADRGTATYWSVLLQGMASEVDEVPGHRGAALTEVSWTAPPHDLRCIRIDATLVSGRRFPLVR